MFVLLTIIAAAFVLAAPSAPAKIQLSAEEYRFLRNELDIMLLQLQSSAVKIAPDVHASLHQLTNRFIEHSRLPNDRFLIHLDFADIMYLIGWRGDFLASLPTDEELLAAAPEGGVVKYAITSPQIRGYMGRVRNAAANKFKHLMNVGPGGNQSPKPDRAIMKEGDRLYNLARLFNEPDALASIERGYIYLNRQMVDFLVEINYGPLMQRLAEAGRELLPKPKPNPKSNTADKKDL